MSDNLFEKIITEALTPKNNLKKDIVVTLTSLGAGVAIGITYWGPGYRCGEELGKYWLSDLFNNSATKYILAGSSSTSNCLLTTQFTKDLINDRINSSTSLNELQISYDTSRSSRIKNSACAIFGIVSAVPLALLNNPNEHPVMFSISIVGNAIMNFKAFSQLRSNPTLIKLRSYLYDPAGLYEYRYQLRILRDRVDNIMSAGYNKFKNTIAQSQDLNEAKNNLTQNLSGLIENFKNGGVQNEGLSILKDICKLGAESIAEEKNIASCCFKYRWFNTAFNWTMKTVLASYILGLGCTAGYAFLTINELPKILSGIGLPKFINVANSVVCISPLIYLIMQTSRDVMNTLLEWRKNSKNSDINKLYPLIGKTLVGLLTTIAFLSFGPGAALIMQNLPLPYIVNFTLTYIVSPISAIFFNGSQSPKLITDASIFLAKYRKCNSDDERQTQDAEKKRIIAISAECCNSLSSNLSSLSDYTILKLFNDNNILNGDLEAGEGEGEREEAAAKELLDNLSVDINQKLQNPQNYEGEKGLCAKITSCLSTCFSTIFCCRSRRRNRLGDRQRLLPGIQLRPPSYTIQPM